MLTMNRATLLGHAGRNPEMRTLPSGDVVALFSLATTERFTRRDGTAGESTEWHAIVAFGGAAQTVRKLVHRGAPVLVEGRIATRTWTDRSGTEHRTSEILVSGPQARVNVLTKRSREPGGGKRPDGAAPAGPATPADADRDDGSAEAAAAPASGEAADSGAAGEADTGSGGAGSGVADEDGAAAVRTAEAEGTTGGNAGDAADTARDGAERSGADEAAVPAEHAAGPEGDSPDAAAGADGEPSGETVELAGTGKQTPLPLDPADKVDGERSGEGGPEHDATGQAGAADAAEAGDGADRFGGGDDGHE